MKDADVPLLSVRGLGIWFDRDGDYLKAVDQASLEIARGEIVGLIGQSGSGKTTLAMGLLGLVNGFPGVWRGTAFLEGKPLLPDTAAFAALNRGKVAKRQAAFQSAHRGLLRDVLGREIAVIFQEPKASLDPFYTVGAHMLEALDRNRGRISGDPRAAGLELLKDVGLVDAENLWGLYPHEISGGMAQRVMISMALCARPKLLIADEPSTSLDVTTQAKLLELFLRLRDKHGLSILIISHDIGVIREISSRIYVMHRGSVVETGGTAAALAAPKHPYTASLLESFSRFGEKQAAPPLDPGAGAGCAYRDMCAAYNFRLSEDAKIRCREEKPAGQSGAVAAVGPAPTGEAWAKCHFPELSKAHLTADRATAPSVPAAGDAMAPSAAGKDGDAVILKSLRKTFAHGKRSFLALNDISLSIPRGKTYGLVGESGSGKSTLGLSLMALQSVDGGEVLYGSENVLALSKQRLRTLRGEMRMLFQHPEGVLNGGMTVAAILAEGLEREKGMSPAERDKRVAEALEQVRLDPSHAGRYPSNLSSGEKQRVTIARALITKPSFLVCDEPVASLDLAIQSQVMFLLKKFQAELGLTYLFISHNLPLVRILAHRIGIMYMGFLVEEALVENFTVQGARHPYTRLLLASAPTLENEGFKDILDAYPDVEPVRLSGGCPFRNRCPLYLANPLQACEKEMPPLKEYAGGIRVACHQVEGSRLGVDEVVSGR